MIGFVAKIGLAGGVVTSVILVDTSNVNSNTTRNKMKKTVKENFETIEDIELFEKTYGCSFVYIFAWADKVLYSARGMVDKAQPLFPHREIKKEVIKGANLDNAKSTCKSKQGVVTLNNSGNRTNDWKLEPPKDGW